MIAFKIHIMNYSAIEHKAFDNYCYCLNENQVLVTLKTGKDIDKVEIVWGDPFDGGVMGGVELHVKLQNAWNLNPTFCGQ